MNRFCASSPVGTRYAKIFCFLLSTFIAFDSFVSFVSVYFCLFLVFVISGSFYPLLCVYKLLCVYYRRKTIEIKLPIVLGYIYTYMCVFTITFEIYSGFEPFSNKHMCILCSRRQLERFAWILCVVCTVCTHCFFFLPFPYRLHLH